MLPRPSRESLPAWPKSSSAPAPPVRASLSAPPNRWAAGSAPLVSSRLSTSLPASPKTRICEVLATVGVPPATVTPPSLTRILPAASRLTWMLFAVLSPITVSTPALNVAVVAALAGTLVTAIAPAPIAVPASSRRVADPRRARRVFIVFSSGQRRGFHRRCMAVLSLAAANRFAALAFQSVAGFAALERVADQLGGRPQPTTATAAVAAWLIPSHPSTPPLTGTGNSREVRWSHGRLPGLSLRRSQTSGAVCAGSNPAEGASCRGRVPHGG